MIWCDTIGSNGISEDKNNNFHHLLGITATKSIGTILLCFLLWGNSKPLPSLIIIGLVSNKMSRPVARRNYKVGAFKMNTDVDNWPGEIPPLLSSQHVNSCVKKEYTKGIQRIYKGYTQNIHRIYAKDLKRVCKGYTKNIQRVYKQYTKNILRINKKNIQRIYQEYTKNKQRVCKDYNNRFFCVSELLQKACHKSSHRQR